jgi:hypothetical protein
MGLMHVTVMLKIPGHDQDGFESLFLVDSGAIDSMAPASQLTAAGFQPAVLHTNWQTAPCTSIRLRSRESSSWGKSRRAV